MRAPTSKNDIDHNKLSDHFHKDTHSRNETLLKHEKDKDCSNSVPLDNKLKMQNVDVTSHEHEMDNKSAFRRKKD